MWYHAPSWLGWACRPSGAQAPQWCSMPVELTPCSWAALLSEVGGCDAEGGSHAGEQPTTSSSQPAQCCSCSGQRGNGAGGGGGAPSCPGGPSVHVVEDLRQLAPALARLRASMRDSVVAIDLEWRPDFGVGRSRVALLQLASSSVAVLIRTCKLPKGPLPGVLSEFLRWASFAHLPCLAPLVCRACAGGAVSCQEWYRHLWNASL